MDDDTKKFLCPGCKKIPSSEVFQCKNGHSVCNACFTSALTCPCCSASYGQETVHNVELEEMLWKVRFDSDSPSKSENKEGDDAKQERGHSAAWLVDEFATCQDYNGSMEATPDERILISGSKSVVVTGTGGFLEVSGSANVHFVGSPQSVRHSGSGTLIVEGDVNGNLEKTGSGSLFVHGVVKGNLVNSGKGTFSLLGDVDGNVKTSGSSSLSVDGNVHGNMSKKGSGKVTVSGSLDGTLTSKGSGTMSIQSHKSESE